MKYNQRQWLPVKMNIPGIAEIDDWAEILSDDGILLWFINMDISGFGVYFIPGYYYIDNFISQTFSGEINPNN